MPPLLYPLETHVVPVVSSKYKLYTALKQPPASQRNRESAFPYMSFPYFLWSIITHIYLPWYRKTMTVIFPMFQKRCSFFFWLKCNTSLLECFLGGTFLNPQTDCCDFFTRFMKQAYARQQADAQNQSNKTDFICKNLFEVKHREVKASSTKGYSLRRSSCKRPKITSVFTIET